MSVNQTREKSIAKKAQWFPNSLIKTRNWLDFLTCVNIDLLHVYGNRNVVNSDDSGMIQNSTCIAVIEGWKCECLYMRHGPSASSPNCQFCFLAHVTHTLQHEGATAPVWNTADHHGNRWANPMERLRVVLRTWRTHQSKLLLSPSSRFGNGEGQGGGGGG